MCSHTGARLLDGQKLTNLGFPGGSVVKNPPASAGDMGPRRSHIPKSN